MPRKFVPDCPTAVPLRCGTDNCRIINIYGPFFALSRYFQKKHKILSYRKYPTYATLYHILNGQSRLYFFPQSGKRLPSGAANRKRTIDRRVVGVAPIYRFQKSGDGCEGEYHNRRLFIFDQRNPQSRGTRPHDFAHLKFSLLCYLAIDTFYFLDSVITCSSKKAREFLIAELDHSFETFLRESKVMFQIAILKDVNLISIL